MAAFNPAIQSQVATSVAMLWMAASRAGMT